MTRNAETHLIQSALYVDRFLRRVIFRRREREDDFLLAGDEVCGLVPRVFGVGAKVQLRVVQVGKRVVAVTSPHSFHRRGVVLSALMPMFDRLVYGVPGLRGHTAFVGNQVKG